MKVPYARPSKLSDPYSDFTPELLDELLSIPDEKLELTHLRSLLGPFLPAGTYSESIYFLPYAFNHLRKHEDNALDLTTSVTWFISEYANQLEADGLLNSCRAEVMQCFLHWIENFSVIHFDKAECQANGYSLSYFDYVHNSEVVCETLCDLDRFIRHLDIADDFFERLAKPTAPAVSEFVTSKRGINTLQG
jgi:hypothetical protein